MVIQPRNASRDEALQELQRLELLGQLAVGIAHDFANVLQAVQGVAHLLERGAGDPERVRALAQMLSETARRGNLLTDRMLGFARRRNGEDCSDRTITETFATPLKS